MEDPSFKLKEQAQVICTELFNLGEHSMFLSVNATNQTSTILGSSHGMVFLQSRLDIIEQFYKYCSGEETSVQRNTLRKEASSMTDDVANQQNEPSRKTTYIDDTINDQQRTVNIITKQSSDKKLNNDDDRRFDSELNQIDDIFESDAGCLDVEDSVENKSDRVLDQEIELDHETIQRKSNTLDNCDKENEDISSNDQINEKQIGSEDKDSENKKSLKLDDKSYNSPLKRIYKKFRPQFKRGETFDIFLSGKMLYKGVTEITQVLSNKDSEKNKENKDFKISSSKKSGHIVDFSQIKDSDITDIKLEPPPKPVATTSQKTSETIVFKRDSDKKYICSECGKKFIEKHGLILHMRSHTGEKPYKCKFCDKAYQHGSHLKDHVLSHHTPGYRPHVCEVCGKGFPIAARLRSHQRVHKKETPYKCKDCGKTFARIELLRQHLAYKKKGYDIICELCGHKFRENYSLKTHMLTKHGEPEFHCKYCDKKFFKKKNFNVHVNNHLGIHEYTCDCCGIAFSCRGALRRHYKRKAGLFGKGKSRATQKPKSRLIVKEEESVEEDMEINNLWNMG